MNFQLFVSAGSPPDGVTSRCTLFGQVSDSSLPALE